MRRPRKPTPPTTEAIDQFCAAFDDLFARYEERRALRQYLIGLLLPREHNKTLVELASIVPGANRQALHHFLHDAPWRSVYGPGTNTVEGIPGGNTTGTHGCVNVPVAAERWLYSWAPVGTPVRIVS